MRQKCVTLKTGTAFSPDETTMMLGFCESVALRSLMKTPKNGTTRRVVFFDLSRRARARARLYSSLVCLDSRALAKKSS
jgi:hypothetical protein